MIVIYGNKGCSACTLAKKKCASLSLRYEFRDIGYKKWYVEYTQSGAVDLPYVLVNGKPIGGYKELRDYCNDYQSQI
jgi:glutaredoxin